jgi:5-methyltetrahydropteroyltriglutamate--homocysteine methyltransferase
MIAVVVGNRLASLPLLTTTVVGSYPQPDWLIDRERLRERLPPRVRARELWRFESGELERAQDRATLEAVRDQEAAGIDIVGDGETRRESYSNHFVTALAGVDLDHPGEFVERNGEKNLVPRIVGAVRRVRPVEVDRVRFLRSHTKRPVKITVPGPFTMTQQAVDDHYGDERALALALADAVREELADLFAAGADVVQVDEPYLQARPEQARAYAVEAINRAVADLAGTTALHTCFGYAHFKRSRPDGYPFLDELNDCAVAQLSIEAAEPRLDPAVLRRIRDKTVILGVLDLGTMRVETPAEVAARLRAALECISPERLVAAPDCGMKYLSREVAFGKLRALAEGAAIVRAELS